MTIATDLAAITQLIGNSTDERDMQILTYVHSVLTALAAVDTAELTTVDNTVPRFDGTAGALQTSGVTIDNSDNVTGVADLTATGTVDAAAMTADTFTPTTVADITGLTTDAALIQLLTALAAVGLITDNHVES